MIQVACLGILVADVVGKTIETLPPLESADILHVAGPFLMPQFIGAEMAAVLQRAKSLEKTTTLDTVWDFTDRWLSVLEPCLPYLDYMLPSLAEAKQITGRTTPREIAQVLLDHGVGTVGLKLGEDGAYVSAPRRATK